MEYVHGWCIIVSNPARSKPAGTTDAVDGRMNRWIYVEDHHTTTRMYVRTYVVRARITRKDEVGGVII